MRSTGRQPIKPIKPSPSSPAIMLIEPDPPEGDQERGEEDVSDTRNYQAGTRAFREVAEKEREGHEATPEVAGDVREVKQADVKDSTQKRKVTPRARAKTKPPSRLKAAE